jgi:hypothetical protein
MMIRRMVVILMISAFALISGRQAGGQGVARPGAANVEAMKKLSFLVGEWTGEGWTEFVPGQRRTSPITENVQLRLGGTIMIVEGLGKKKAQGEQAEAVTHHAFGIISYDDKAKLYRLRSYLADGRSTDAEASFTDEGFQWRFQVPGNTSIRYTVKLNDKGEWFERGEMSRDGKTWRQFHEMTLQKVK